MSRSSSETGFSMLVTLMVMAVLSLLAGTMVVISQQETIMSFNYRTLTQASFLAEAGARAAGAWFQNTYEIDPEGLDLSGQPVTFNGAPVMLSGADASAGNYPDSSVANSFYTEFHERSVDSEVAGTYSVEAFLLSTDGFGSSQLWRVVSEGRISAVPDALAQVEMLVEVGTESILRYAVFATGDQCSMVSFSSSSYTDSWDSSQGSYLDTQTDTGGDVGTNGHGKLTGSAVIRGRALVLDPLAETCADGPGFEACPTCIYEGRQSLPAPVVFPEPPPTTPGSQDESFSGGVNSLAPGEYGDLEVSGGGTLNLAPGDYVFNSIVLSGGSVLAIDPPGQVTIHLAGEGVAKAIDISGGSFYNPSGVPADLQIFYAGSSNSVLSGGSGSYGVFYSPNSPTTISGGGEWFGSVIAYSLTNTGGSAIHYDRSLGGLGLLGQSEVKILSFSRSSF